MCSVNTAEDDYQLYYFFMIPNNKNIMNVRAPTEVHVLVIASGTLLSISICTITDGPAIFLFCRSFLGISVVLCGLFTEFVY